MTCKETIGALMILVAAFGPILWVWVKIYGWRWALKTMCGVLFVMVWLGVATVLLVGTR